jgi:hypothetical protein
MFKMQVACGLLVLVAVYAASQQPRPMQRGTEGGGVVSPSSASLQSQDPKADEGSNLRELMARLREVRKQRDKPDKEEARRLVARIRKLVATQRAELDRVERSLGGTSRIYLTADHCVNIAKMQSSCIVLNSPTEDIFLNGRKITMVQDESRKICWKPHHKDIDGSSPRRLAIKLTRDNKDPQKDVKDDTSLTLTVTISTDQTPLTRYVVVNYIDDSN